MCYNSQLCWRTVSSNFTIALIVVHLSVGLSIRLPVRLSVRLQTLFLGKVEIIIKYLCLLSLDVIENPSSQVNSIRKTSIYVTYCDVRKLTHQNPWGTFR